MSKSGLKGLSKTLRSKKVALFVEKVSVQMIIVGLIFLIFGINTYTILANTLIAYISEIVWYTHPKTREKEGYSMMVAGLFTLTFAALANNLLIGLILKSFGLLLLIVGSVRTVWKVSAHMAGTSFVFTIASLLGNGLLAVSTLAALPLVGWSRLKLKRHTFSQVIVGSILGLVIPVLLL